MTAPESLAPIERSILVSWDPKAAFERFTAGFAGWWPRSTHSIGGHLLKDVVFECREGGRIYEELRDGRRFQWGVITAWDPPHRVGFTWHPSEDESAAQDVEVRFVLDQGGTRVVLTSSGWERLGPKGARKRKGYSIGWGAVMDVYAGRSSVAVVVFAMISRTMSMFLRLTGRYAAEVNKAGGQMPPSSVTGATLP